MRLLAIVGVANRISWGCQRKSVWSSGVSPREHERQGGPPAGLRTLASWQLSQAALHGHRLVVGALATESLGKHHFSVMLSLDERGGASQAELGRALGIDRSDMAATVVTLEGRGLIGRARDSQDRRRNVVRLTPAGTETLERLRTRVTRAQEDLLIALKPHERAQLTQLLTSMLERTGGS